MKKSFIIFSLIFSFLASPLVSAAESADEKITQRQEAFQDLQKALFKRYVRYRKNKQRNAGNTNRIAQQLQHKINRAEKGVTERSTKMERTGKLRFVPYYVKRRGTSKLSSQVPNTVKRNFRVRAFDYYVEGGEAGRKVLVKNAYKSRDHKIEVKSTLDNPTAKNVAGIIKMMRKQQKYRAKFSDAPAGYQETIFRTGAWRRNLVHPYMFKKRR